MSVVSLLGVLHLAVGMSSPLPLPATFLHLSMPEDTCTPVSLIYNINLTCEWKEMFIVCSTCQVSSHKPT